MSYFRDSDLPHIAQSTLDTTWGMTDKYCCRMREGADRREKTVRRLKSDLQELKMGVLRK